MDARGNEKNLAELRTATSDHLRSLSLDHCFGVSLTLKQQRDGIWLDEIRASKNLRHFLNRLNTAVYGKAFKRFGRRLNVISVLERSSSGRLHYHLVLKNPYPDSPHHFERMIEIEWSKTHFGYQQTHVHLLIDHGWTDYIGKIKSAGDGIDGENSHWN